MLTPRKILVLAPHTDDGELGCGGSIAKWCRQGVEVYYAAFCLCAKSLPAHLPADTLATECRNATAALGINPQNVLLFDFEVRELPAARQAVLDKMLQLNKDLAPDLVLIPAADDVHQDHQVIHQEAIRAFKYCTLAGYELPWNNFSFTSRCFIRLEEEDLHKKTAALLAYRSQSHRNYMKPEFIRSLATVRGVQSNASLAEAFDIYRILS